MADSVGLALLVVLESLTPAERLAFVLHDVFGIPFDEIAPVVQRSPAATRQLASRARRRVRAKAPDPDADLAVQWRVVDAFIAAAREGDFEALLQVLDPNVVLRVDGGRNAPPAFARPPLVGAEAVARGAVSFRGAGPYIEPVIVNGAPGVMLRSRLGHSSGPSRWSTAESSRSTSLPTRTSSAGCLATDHVNGRGTRARVDHEVRSATASAGTSVHPSSIAPAGQSLGRDDELHSRHLTLCRAVPMVARRVSAALTLRPKMAVRR